MTIEPIRCPVCKDADLSAEDAVAYNSEENRKDYLQKIIFCPECTTGVGHPMPADEFIEDIYKASEYWGPNVPEIDIRRQPVMYSLAKSRWELIKTLLPARDRIKVIDIGSGYGYFGLVAASAANVSMEEYVSVEADQRLHSVLQSAWPKWNPDTKLSLHASLEQVNGSADIVSLSHILEHVQDPIGLVNRVMQLVVEDGVIFIDVPNRDFEFKKDVFPHLLFFSEKSLKTLLEKAGLQVLHLSAWGTSAKSSPMNDNSSMVMRLVCSLLNKFSRLLPRQVAIYLYSQLYGVGTQRKNGVWLRAVAKRNNRTP